MLHTSLFDGSYVSAVVDGEHLRLELREPNDFLAEPREVARRAESYIRRLRQWQDGDLTAADIVSATYGGCCVYTISHYGFSYTHLARLATKTVADVVAAISGDPRLDVGQRRQAQCAAVACASNIAQVVTLAELMSEAKKLVGLASADWLRKSSGFGQANYYELQTWTEHAYNLLLQMQERLFARQRFVEQQAKLGERLHELHARTRIRKLPRKSRPAFIEQQGAYASLLPVGDTETTEMIGV